MDIVYSISVNRYSIYGAYGPRGEPPSDRFLAEVIYRPPLSGRSWRTVTIPQNPDRWEAELRALREELRELKSEQHEMAVAINQLVTTFRTLATHLGIAAEPYVRKDAPTGNRDLPGFA